MLFNIVLILAGFFLLIGGAEYLVRGSSSLAKKLGMRTFVIGLTVVAFGTSAPELVVNILSATSDASGLAIGNIFGSNIANILLILGVTAMLAPISVQKGTIWKEIPFSLLAAIMIVVMGSDMFLNGLSPDQISRSDGISLLALFLIFLYYTYGISKAKGEATGEKIELYPTWKTAAYIFGGLLGLVLGGKLIVDGSVSVAQMFGVSDHLIGLTIVAIGTSLPELATAIVAARKGQVDLAVGNVVGSNIFNILFVLGTTATITPIAYAERATQDGLMVMLVSILLFIGMFIGDRSKLDKWKGLAFVLLYIAYIAFSVFRG